MVLTGYSELATKTVPNSEKMELGERGTCRRTCRFFESVEEIETLGGGEGGGRK